MVMSEKRTNFDRYLTRKLRNEEFRERFAQADRAWDVALQLAALRAARGLTQQQVADLLGTKQQAIARLENPAYTGHNLNTLRRYAELLGASLQVNIVPKELLPDGRSTPGYVQSPTVATSVLAERGESPGRPSGLTEPDSSAGHDTDTSI
jgi:transcriptional regulator with XRE-family HTH domain